MIIFDVGANDGSSCFHLAANNPHVTVFAFEPTPQLVEVLRERTRHLRNYLVVPKAVSNYTGTAVFNVVGLGDWGCSSLRQFNSDLERAWPGRTDFKVTHTIEVDVIKLRDFVVEQGIGEIEYLHVDVQGDDLNVLAGLEDKLGIVKAGNLEAPVSSSVALYRDQHTVEDVKQFLLEHGFTIDEIKSNDAFNNEVNVFFKRL